MNITGKIRRYFFERNKFPRSLVIFGRLLFNLLKEVKNWSTYFLDFLSLTKKKYCIYYMNNGLKYICRTGYEDRGCINVMHLRDDYEIKKIRLSRDSTVIDIGANIGIFSCMISQQVKKVYSYEPAPENFKILSYNVKLNKLANKVRIHNYAVCDKTGKLRIYLGKDTVTHSMYGKGANYIESDSISLKDIIDTNNISTCDLIKLDAEGAEYSMLYALPKNYFEKIKRIHLEYHDFDDQKLNHESLKSFLEKNGFIVTHKKSYLIAKHK